MCLGWLLGLWDNDTDRADAYAAADALAEAEAVEEVSSPGFHWTGESPQSSATTPAPPATGGRQTRPAPPTTQPVVDGAGRTKSEILDEAAGVISMLLPGNDLVDELRVFASEYREFEHHGPVLDRLIAAAEQPE